MALHPTACPLDCPDACGVLVETDAAGGLVRLRGNPAHPYSRGTLCSKTSVAHELMLAPDRLVTPLVRADGALRSASWDEALARIAAAVKPLDGREILALQYAGSMGLLAANFPLRVMNALGACTHDAGVCDNTSSAGYAAVLGRLVGPDVETAEESDALVVWGSDVKRTIQHLQPQLQRLAKRGAPVRVVDVWRTETLRAFEKLGGRGLVLRPGTDAALALCLARLAFERGWVDRARLAAECVGAAELEAHLGGAPTLAEAARVTGLTPEEILDLGEVLRAARRPFLRTGSGWTRRTNGAMGMRAVCTLAAVLGHADRVHYESAEVFGFDRAFVTRPELRGGRPPEVVHQIQVGRELCAGRFKAVFVWGHNPAVTLPNSRAVREGLAREDVFVVVHEQVRTETAELADVVLPATFFVEHTDVYRSYGHRVAQLGRRAVAAPTGPRSNVRAFSAIARALALPGDWDVDEERLAEELVRDAEARHGAAATASLLAGEPTRIAPPAERGTPSGKVELHSAALAAAGHPPMATWVPERPTGGARAFSLVSAPSKHTHNSTYSYSPLHLARRGPARCHLNPADARALGVEEGRPVRLVNDLAALTFAATLDADVPPGLVRVDGMPRAADTPEGLPLNALNADDLSDLGDGTTYYSTRVDVEPA
ncbi:MAG: molybdopterin-dependent oxidoreductase [Planctomycetes bacterium]|nr:molybdopterin-dependent oxidoreductase [Planctomycetota bacterium]